MAKLVIEKVLDALSASFDAKQEAVRAEILKTIVNSLPGITKKYLDDLFSASGNDPVPSKPATTKMMLREAKEHGVGSYSFEFKVNYVVPLGSPVHKYAEFLIGLLTQDGHMHPGGKRGLGIEGGVWSSKTHVEMQATIERTKPGDKNISVNVVGIYYGI